MSLHRIIDYTSVCNKSSRPNDLPPFQTKMKEEGKKRRRSMAIPETTKDLPTNKKLKDDIVDKQPETELPKQSIMMEVQDQTGQSTPVTEIDRRKRLREILKVITRILREKDVFNIVHSPPCPLLYPNYNFNEHFDMSHVAKRIDQLCYYNIYQFRQAVDNVTKIQTDFFPHNTVRKCSLYIQLTIYSVFYTLLK